MLLRMELKWVWFLRIALASMTVLLVLADACFEHERIALLQLKPFFNHHNDLVDWDEVKGSDCYEWVGIECNTSTRRLIGLSLNFARYYDKGWYLNTSLFLPFVDLKSLYLQGNSIAGCFENEGFEKLSSNLSNLKILDLSENYLNDSIMLSLSELSSLRYLSLAYNHLEGSNHRNGFQWLSRLGNLETLDLSGNSLKNNIMLHMNGFSSLKTLSLKGNFLKGKLLHIQELNNLTKLKYLDLSGNGIESLESYKDDATKRQQMIHFEELHLGGNLFNNSVFASLNGFPNLRYLDISFNQLKGSLVMKDLDAFSSLRELYMSNNQLKDFVIHKGCCDLKKLEVLDLSGNAFEGMLPHGLGNLNSLRELDVSDNQFSGNLTPLSNLTSLRFLSLSRNHLEIPTSFAPLANLPNLKLLYADENKMVMESSFHSSLPKFQLKLISVSKCITSQELTRELLTFLYYQYDLIYVDLSGNDFSGALPIWLLQNNTKLEFLILRGNAFSGLLSLPSPPNLNASLVDISDNKLQGPIPSNICSAFPQLLRNYSYPRMPLKVISPLV